jgi:hypothetical protein
MEEHPDFAKGRVESTNFGLDCQSHWEILTEELNVLGPPVKTKEQWIRVWYDLKDRIRRKIREHKKAVMATGGGNPESLPTLSEIEKRINGLLNLEQHVIGIPNTRKFGANAPVIEKQAQKKDDTPKDNEPERDDGIETVSTPVTKRRRTINMLQDHKDCSERQMDDIISEMRSINVNLEKQNDLLAERNRIVNEMLRLKMVEITGEEVYLSEN